MLDQVLVSRSTLERSFRSYLGRSPQAEIRAVQLARARQLLAETDHPVHRIAELVGFEHVEYFNVVFKREIGLTPGLYRRQSRGHDLAGKDEEFHAGLRRGARNGAEKTRNDRRIPRGAAEATE